MFFFVSSDWLRLIQSNEDILTTAISTGLEARFLDSFSYNHVAIKVLPGLGNKILSRHTQLVLHDIFPSDIDFHVIASHLPHLESIAVEDQVIRALVNFLNMHTQHVPDTPIGIFFPILKNITFDQGNCDQETWEELLNCFRLRQSWGAPIQSLCMNKLFWPDSGVLASLNDLSIVVDHRVGHTRHVQD